MKTPKLVVIGLDGADPGILSDLVKAGKTPFLGRFINEGVVTGLKSCLPPVSAPAWTAMVTGKNAGKTGIYDFLTRAENSYDIVPIDASTRKGAAMWDITRANDLSIGVFNLPAAYPAPADVNGWFIPGWLTSRNDPDYMRPSGLKAELEAKLGPYPLYPRKVHARVGLASAGIMDFYAEVEQIMDYQFKCLDYLIESRPVDVLFAVFFDSDRCQHELWHTFDATHPAHRDSDPDLISRYFEQLDRRLQDYFGGYPADTHFLLVSDHGFGPIHRLVFPNLWLLEQGFLKLKKGVAPALKRAAGMMGFNPTDLHRLSLAMGAAPWVENANFDAQTGLIRKCFLSFNDVDWLHTKAYAYGLQYGCVYLNRMGREPKGAVTPEKAGEVIAELKRKIGEWRDPVTGGPFIKHIYSRPDVFHGACEDLAPDLILEPSDPATYFFGVADFGAGGVLRNTYRFTGTHRRLGVFGARGPKIRHRDDVRPMEIYDVLPNLVQILGLGVPDDLDGEVRAELFRNERDADVRKVAPPAASRGRSDRDEQDLRKQLKGLGYLT